jgi:hypothetical protein
MHEVGARYIVETPLGLGAPRKSQDGLRAFIQRHQSALTLIFSNERFNLYETRFPIRPSQGLP